MDATNGFTIYLRQRQLIRLISRALRRAFACADADAPLFDSFSSGRRLIAYRCRYVSTARRQAS